MPFFAAVQTTEAGAPIVACFSQRPFTEESLSEFAATSLVAPATLVSDGLGCFLAIQGGAILHERYVTGGGVASMRRPEFAAVNTILGNLKTALAGRYHVFDFAKYAHRYLALVQYQFNRRFDLRSILGRLARTACRATARPLRTLRLDRAPVELEEAGVPF